MQEQLEQKLIEAFRRMAPDAQQEIVRFAVSIGVRSSTTRPVLRVVNGKNPPQL
jgi:hypothetical protein